MSPIYVIGDVHGQYDKLFGLLRFDADLITPKGDWNGGDAQVCFIGDYFDRGPDGIAVIDLIIRLQQQAKLTGGAIHTLLGNHEVLLLAASVFATQRQSSHFMASWVHAGGQINDLQRLTSRHIKWLIDCPAMLRLDDYLLIHADSMLYRRYGETVTTVNRAIRYVLNGTEPAFWNALIDRFTDRYAFSATDWYGHPQAGGEERAQAMLATYGGSQIIHGHTPIFRMTDQPPDEVNTAYPYADGLCVNVDHALYAGGSGFVYRLSS
jgi:hypothetical protein